MTNSAHTAGHLSRSSDNIAWSDCWDHGHTLPNGTEFYYPDPWPLTQPVTTYSWSYPMKATLTVEEVNILKEAVKENKKLGPILKKLKPYIEVTVDF